LNEKSEAETRKAIAGPQEVSFIVPASSRKRKYRLYITL